MRKVPLTLKYAPPSFKCRPAISTAPQYFKINKHARCLLEEQWYIKTEPNRIKHRQDDWKFSKLVRSHTGSRFALEHVGNDD